MLLIVILIVIACIAFIIHVVKNSKSVGNYESRPHVSYGGMDDLDDEMMYRQIMEEEDEDFRESAGFHDKKNFREEGKSFPFAYTDPADMDPADLMYFGEDGELNEDL